MNFIIIKAGMVLVNSDSRIKPREGCLFDILFACYMRLKMGFPIFYGLALANASQFGGAPLAAMTSCGAPPNYK